MLFELETIVNWFRCWFKQPIARLRHLAQGWSMVRAIALQTMLCVALSTLLLGPAQAALTDDNYDGNIFPLYAGNGSLVPPRVRLPESRQRDRVALLFFYLDDSSDCKQFVPVVSQLDSFYGRAADIIPISVDMIPVKSSYTPDEPGHYYTGRVPQLVVLNQRGEMVFDESGANMSYEKIDDVLREVFDLLPRSESVELKRRVVNEINVELSK